MANLPEYKLKIFSDALVALEASLPTLVSPRNFLALNSTITDDELAFAVEDVPNLYDESADDIAADLIEVQLELRKGRRKLAQQKWRQTEAGKAATKAWNESKEKKAWLQTEAGRIAKKRERKTWKQTENGKISTNTTQRKKSLDRYLNRRTVAIDGEGRPPLHTILNGKWAPLKAWKILNRLFQYLDRKNIEIPEHLKQKKAFVLKHLKKDSSGYYWEPHELSLIGAASIDRPYGTSIEKGIWEPPVWIELNSKNQSEQAFEYLLSLPNHYNDERGKTPLYIMFSASYDWSMWLRDTPFGKAFEIARQRGFTPPCKRMRGMVFWKKYAIKVRPYFDFKLSELRWPDDPYGKDHTDDPAYKKPGKNAKVRLQVIRRITITDTFRFAPKAFVKAIEPLMKRGLIPKDVFDTIEREKKKRGAFHLEKMENVKKYCGYELHTLCVFMHMIRDACWTSAQLRLKSFHSPAAIASVLLKRIDVRAHGWPVKSVNLEYEQEIAHWSYFGGRFEWVLKGYNKAAGYQIDLASAYPYAMQFLPSMAGESDAAFTARAEAARAAGLLEPQRRGGRWEKWASGSFEPLTPGGKKVSGEKSEGIENPLLNTLTRKTVEQSCILSIFRVRFNFYADAPFYALPYRMPDSVILYPRMGSGYYMRDDVLNAFDWCRKYKIPIDKAVIIKEANFFHPAEDAVQIPFALIADIYMKRIEFDKRDPKGPEQEVLKGGINSTYGKLAERRYRGDDPKTGEPIIPPHACPWYASAITAHTRRELMKVALLAPELVIGFATDAIYLDELPDNIPRRAGAKSQSAEGSERSDFAARLKSEADIKAGKEDKLLGDWCWAKVPAAVFIQSGLALYLDDNGKVMEVKCRGMPLKNLKRAQAFLDDVREALKEPYEPNSIRNLKPKKGRNRPIARHASVEIHAFMPLASAIMSQDKFNNFFCRWGDIIKTIWLDDTGGKRTINEFELDCLGTEAIPTSPKENPHPEILSAARFPDWVENKIREEKRQEAAVNQFYKIEENEIEAWGCEYEDDDDGEFVDDGDDVILGDDASRELDRLMEMNMDIEI